MDTEYSLENRPKAMDNSDGWWKWELGKSVRAAQHDNDDDDV